MKGHIHQALMAQYAEDAKTTDKPWELWELSGTGKADWVGCSSQSLWSLRYQYRRKLKTKLIHGVEVPDISFTPSEGQNYVYPALLAESLAVAARFYNGLAYCELAAEYGMCYPATEEGQAAAIMHAKAMLGIAP